MKELNSFKVTGILTVRYGVAQNICTENEKQAANTFAENMRRMKIQPLPKQESMSSVFLSMYPSDIEVVEKKKTIELWGTKISDSNQIKFVEDFRAVGLTDDSIIIIDDKPSVCFGSQRDLMRLIRHTKTDVIISYDLEGDFENGWLSAVKETS